MGERILRMLAGALIALSLVPVGARAEQFQQFGEYVVHYNTINTSFLSAQVAREYGIRRSGNRAMLNVAVQKGSNGPIEPLRATISVVATNLSGQLRHVDMRAVEDGDAVYYIGELPIEDGDVLDFDVQVQPEGSAQPLQLRFREQFFVR